MKLKISRRQAKESINWLNLMLVYESEQLEAERKLLVDEAEQIRKILSASVKSLEGESCALFLCFPCTFFEF
jgi:hypothetical protein